MTRYGVVTYPPRQLPQAVKQVHVNHPVNHGGDCVVSCRDFWNAKDSWYPTWAADVDNGEQAAMAVD